MPEGQMQKERKEGTEESGSVSRFLRQSYVQKTTRDIADGKNVSAANLFGLGAAALVASSPYLGEEARRLEKQFKGLENVPKETLAATFRSVLNPVGLDVGPVSGSLLTGGYKIPITHLRGEEKGEEQKIKKSFVLTLAKAKASFNFELKF